MIMTRQESHRIYLQSFAPRSAHPNAGSSSKTTLHRHDSHDIHPPEYPTTSNTNPSQNCSNSSSDSSLSSYSFSSSFSSRHGSSGNQSRNSNSYPDQKFVGSLSSVTTTAAVVRLSEKAKTKDVTPLLRGKFGLPRISNEGNQSTTAVYRTKADTSLNLIPPLSNTGDEYKKSNNNCVNNGNNMTHKPTISNTVQQDEVDTLVLIGTCERPPKGYIRFEHEEFLEEKVRLDKFRQHYNYIMEQQYHGHMRLSEEDTVGVAPTLQHIMERRNIPVSESTTTVKASGGKPGWTSSMLLVSEDAPLCTSSNSSESSSLLHSLSESARITNSMNNSAIGLDLSSSRGSVPGGSNRGGERVSTWAAIGVEEGTTQNGQILDYSMPMVSSQESPRPLLEFDTEPIHIVRTLLPEEHPLQVRDEMLVKLMHLREKAEDEMGFHLTYRERGEVELLRPPPTFRWYFQPCSPLGGTGSSASSPKVQCIPAYIDVDGYCTEDESDSESGESNDMGNGDVEWKVDNEEDASTESELPPDLRRLIKERRRIHTLRELCDPPFVVSGYLLKQSLRDPNVWRRVYCVLTEDRLWTIQRMKPLQKSNKSEGISSSLRVGRNQYITLHRCLLLEQEEGAELTRQYSDSRCSGYHLSPLNQRLRFAFRVITAQGQAHTFRAFTSQSVRVWVTSLSERIAQMHGVGMMDLANVIAEEETLARCRRMNGVAIGNPLPLRCSASIESS